ncbi:MFS transporter [Glycomyces sp. TRM65418]|uniref:MFS transporter n=1 Tax=Glycomyces sp. TRM65418 TaxID=2867006 RepID=UPI001CE51078|nr:MFS transporter [Glycomyces sp. TRM65418]MCC3761940.1 MFS transporter [Glycomyces sp. TRM65418]QZD56019.1 MFS transporter [Glycomyces sp. TRM65418]
MDTSTAPARLGLGRDFRLLASGRVTSQLGDQIQFLALPLLVVALTGSTIQAGIVLGAQTITSLAFGLLAGALADRWDRKRTMIACDLGRAALTATIPIAALFGSVPMGLLYAVAVANGLLGTLFGAASTSALPNLVDAEDLTRALGGLGAIENTVRLAGASIAGLVYTLGRTVPFAANAVTFLVSAATLHRIRHSFQQETEARQGAPTPRALLADMREGLAWLWRKPVIRTLALLDAGDALRYGAGYLLIIALAASLDASPTQIGIVFTGAALGALLGNLFAPKLSTRFALGRLAIAMLWVEALTFPFYAIAPTWWLLLVVAFAESVVSPVYNVALDSYRLARTPDRMRGRVTAGIGAVVTGASAIGAVASGSLIAAIGPAALTWALAGWLALLATAATLSGTVRRAE